uniref:norbelladine synthase-like n=1 Tax=Erigeron canadensis TaxID=72917 RepID=UPI001CB944B5|nr:norbelladine synthase-like [Erigeron canadensis]
MFGTLVSEDVEIKVEPSKAWKFWSSLDFVKVVSKETLDKLEVEGDGGVGTILNLIFKPGFWVPSYKEKFVKVDHENMVKEAEVVEGGFLDIGFSLYRARIEIKVNPKDETGSSCVVKATIEYEVKEEAASNVSLVNMDRLVYAIKIAGQHLENSS